MKKKKEESKEELDNGSTISPMDAEWMPWNVGKSDPRKIAREDADGKRKESLDISKKEKRAIVRGAVIANLPTIVGFAVVGVLLYLFAKLWLKS